MAGRRVEVARAGLFVPGMGDLHPGRRFDADEFGANAAHLVKSGALRWVEEEPKPEKPAPKATATKKAAAKPPAAEG
jgi:hypothetical protein